MSAIKERILGAITVMSEDDAAKIWEIIKMQFSFAIDTPTDEEMEIFSAYKRGDDEFQPYISHEELKRELGLE